MPAEVLLQFRLEDSKWREKEGELVAPLRTRSPVGPELLDDAVLLMIGGGEGQSGRLLQRDTGKRVRERRDSAPQA